VSAAATAFTVTKLRTHDDVAVLLAPVLALSHPNEANNSTVVAFQEKEHVSLSSPKKEANNSSAPMQKKIELTPRNCVLASKK